MSKAPRPLRLVPPLSADRACVSLDGPRKVRVSSLRRDLGPPVPGGYRLLLLWYLCLRTCNSLLEFQHFAHLIRVGELSP